MRDIKQLILTAGPSITEREVAYGIDAIRDGWNSHHSDYIGKFEEAFRSYTGASYAMATSSCTGAMHLALVALGIGPGDEVVVPEITWVATAAVVTYVGATPVFCDVDKESWTMCPKSLEKAITSKTKAIMPVHIYGHPCDMEPIWQLAQKHNLKIIEDAAQSIGAEYKGQRTGSLGDMAAFSFQGAKALVTGEGGILLCKDQALFERAKFKGDQGRDPNRALFNIEIGYKYKMSNVQASIGLAQTERVEEIVEKKRQIYSWYKERLGGIDLISLNVEKSWAKNIYWMTSIILSEKVTDTRDEFMQKLKEHNVDNRPIFYPLSGFPMFDKANNPNAYFIGNRGINLPSGHNLTEEEVDYICGTVKLILNAGKGNVIRGWLNHREEVWSKIHNIKSSESSSNNLPIKNDNGQNIGLLVPIVKEISQEDIHLLKEWRSESQKWFPSQFKVTFEGTKKWVKQALFDDKDRVLYFVLDNNGNKIGHVGLYRFDFKENLCELDNVIRGVSNVEKGIMKYACQTILNFAQDTLGIANIYLRVLSDNERALSLYSRLGFKEVQRVPLCEIENKGVVTWQPYYGNVYKEVARYFVTMKL
jgi:perosamine synthetase